MQKTPPNAGPAKDWRFPLSIGLAIGIGAPVARSLEQALGPDLPSWCRIGASAVLAGLLGGFVGLVVHALLRPAGLRDERTVPGAKVSKDLPG
jgi:hypothetical protein